MGEEIELAADAAAKTVTALAEASGALGPPRELWDALTAGIHYRFYSRTIKQAIDAAEKIRQSGLPVRAYNAIEDPLLHAILEGGAMEEDPSMQERWAALLANALVEGSVRVYRSFADVLSQFEPIEAATLDDLATRASFEESPEELTFTPEQLLRARIDGVGLDNLVGLQLLRYTRKMPTTVGSITDEGLTISGASFPNRGWTFVQACRDPHSVSGPLPAWVSPPPETDS